MANPSHVPIPFGTRYGRLTVGNRVDTNLHGHATYQCECDCGGRTVVPAGALRRKNGTKSCGCLHRDIMRAANAKRHKSYPGQTSWLLDDAMMEV